MTDRRGNPDAARHRIAEALSKLLGTYVDPWDVTLYAVARGYWSHNHQDVQRWTGSFEANGLRYTIGSWNRTLSQIRGGRRFEITDTRGDQRPYNDFQLEPD